MLCYVHDDCTLGRRAAVGRWRLLLREPITPLAPKLHTFLMVWLIYYLERWVRGGHAQGTRHAIGTF